MELAQNVLVLCILCNFNVSLNSTKCSSCYDNYVLNKGKECTYCGNGCQRCSIDENNKTDCKDCYSGTFLEYNKCLICNEGCSKCIIDDSSPFKNESLCTQCKSRYAMTTDKKCTHCQQSNTGGNGCNYCKYNEINSRFECSRCINEYDYTNINNTLQCLRSYDNNDNIQIYLSGCLQAIYIQENDTYECLKCKDDFIKIANDKKCRRIKDIGISNYCEEFINLGTLNNSLYSCNKCQYGAIPVKIKSKGIQDCYLRSNNFNYCIEGEIEENGKHICKKCVEFASINNLSLCECNFDSFGKYNELCYKCDDKKVGIKGCLASKGCKYIPSNDELDCNECEEGYFKYSMGQCYNCESEIKNCNKCHFDQKLKCDNCISIYSLSEEKDKCIIDECQEYPEISPGCIICKDKLEEYLNNKKCQSCKYGYFKTRNDTCVYCNSEEYGGPACYQCGYEIDQDGQETDKIICKDCYSKDKYISFNYDLDFRRYHYSNSALSSKGKCYNCKTNFSESCLKCQFNNDDKLVCTFCLPGYYLDQEGKCISILNKIEIIENCNRHEFNLGKLLFYFYLYDIYNTHLFSDKKEDRNYYINNYINYINDLKNNEYPIKTSCASCFENYYLNDFGECIIYDFKNYIGSTNIKKRMNYCKSLCNRKGYPFIYLRLINNSIDFDYEYNNSLSLDIIDMYDILNNYDTLTNDTKNIMENIPLCYKIPSEDDLIIQFVGCEKVIYLQKKNVYQCFECKDQYIMEYEKHICHKITGNDKNINNCVTQNIGTELSLIYSCIKCNNNDDILVTLDTGAISCIKDTSLENCIQVIANTTYINPVYDCQSCKFNYISYYSKYYERKICQGISEEIIRKKSISFEIFEGEVYINADDEGKKKKLFYCLDVKANTVSLYSEIIQFYVKVNAKMDISKFQKAYAKLVKVLIKAVMIVIMKIIIPIII